MHWSDLETDEGDVTYPRRLRIKLKLFETVYFRPILHAIGCILRTIKNNGEIALLLRNGIGFMKSVGFFEWRATGFE